MAKNIYQRNITTKSGEKRSLWYVILEAERGVDGKRRQRWHGGYKSLEHALAMRDEFKLQIINGTYVSRRKLSYEEWAQDFWIPSVRNRVKPSTLHGYEQDLRLYIYPRLGKVPLTSISAEGIDRLYRSLLIDGGARGKALSVATVCGVHSILSNSLEQAFDFGFINKNPATKVRAPKEKTRLKSAESCWSIPELQLFLKEIEGDPLEMILRLAVMTGMRRGEILGLRWRDVDFDNSRISVCSSIIHVRNQVVVSTPKSNRARSIQLDEETLDRLRVFRMDQQAWGEQPEDDGFAADLVFREPNGKRFVPAQVTARFNKLLSEIPVRRIRFHDLRHTHASLCVAMGIPINVVQQRLGHARPETTLNLYAHVLPGTQNEAARLFAQRLSSPSTPSLWSGP